MGRVGTLLRDVFGSSTTVCGDDVIVLTDSSSSDDETPHVLMYKAADRNPQRSQPHVSHHNIDASASSSSGAAATVDHQQQQQRPMNDAPHHGHHHHHQTTPTSHFATAPAAVAAVATQRKSTTWAPQRRHTDALHELVPLDMDQRSLRPRVSDQIAAEVEERRQVEYPKRSSAPPCPRPQDRASSRRALPQQAEDARGWLDGYQLPPALTHAPARRGQPLVLPSMQPSRNTSRSSVSLTSSSPTQRSDRTPIMRSNASPSRRQTPRRRDEQRTPPQTDDSFSTTGPTEVIVHHQQQDRLDQQQRRSNRALRRASAGSSTSPHRGTPSSTCRWCGMRDPHHRHQDSCPQRKMRCRKCEQLTLFRDKDHHREVCPRRGVSSSW
jgi:hypothetical protein